ncbi:MAG: hypothetical protein ACI3ZA_07985, partial [Alloprevotella sp.]
VRADGTADPRESRSPPAFLNNIVCRAPRRNSSARFFDFFPALLFLKRIVNISLTPYFAVSLHNIGFGSA